MKNHLTPRVSLAIGLALLCIFTTLLATSFLHSRNALAATNGPALTVDATAGRHSINSDIYGMANEDATLQKDIKLPQMRWGGDYTTNYNWYQDSSNSGSDWYYMGGNGTSTPTAGATVDTIINNQLAVGGHSLITIPTIGYVNNSSVWNCSYPSSQYPAQQSYDPYVKLANGDQCGNGKDTSGNLLTDNNISQNYLSVDPNWMQAWVQHIVQAHGNSSSSGVTYQLDNEPENWNIVHYDVHPQPAGYDEVLNDSINYAKMIKATDPSAQIVGPSDGYSYAYVHLKDKPGDDINSHNGMPWLAYYLQQMKNYQDQNGTRLLDYLDVHYYSNYSNNNDDATTDAARLDATRALWDPTFSDSNSVGQYLNPKQNIGQIQALRNWINQYYPGTKLSISEYSLGNAKTLNGALTEADVLGIFGRENLDAANYWDGTAATDPTAYAFRMYLNYDGKGSRFGDTAVQSSSANQGQLSIYGAQRSSDGALTLVLVNKTGGDLTSSLALSNFSAGSSAQMYTYSGANLSAIVQQSDLSVNGNSITATYPANSITTIVIPTGNGGGNQGTFSTGFESGDPQPTWSNTVDNNGYPAGGSANIGGICCGQSAPEAGVRSETAHNGSSALMYSGNATNSSGTNYAYMQVFDLSGQNITVGSSTTLSYWIYPQNSSSMGYATGNSTCVAIDLIFQDGSGNQSNLRDSGATDQNGNRAHPAYQCNHLTPNTWNQVTVNLGTHSNGLKIVRLDVGYDQPNATGGYRGYIDDISIHS